MVNYEDDEYEVPLQDQRYFGAGIKRKRIHFVAASRDGSSNKLKSDSSTATDKYLDIVLGKQKRPISEGVVTNNTATQAYCEVCQKSLPAGDTIETHESGIVHQIAVQHSHPPSAVDRTSKAYAVLKSQGWDADSRLGLGALGEGILHPIKAVENPSRVGLGAKTETIAIKPSLVRLDAGKTRAQDKQSRKKLDDLREQFYRSEAIDRLMEGNEDSR